MRVPWGLRLRLRLPGLLAEAHRPFHSVAALALLVLAACRWSYLWPVAWGALFHRLQDWWWECVHVPHRRP